jgi:hypothetical protein
MPTQCTPPSRPIRKIGSSAMEFTTGQEEQ